MKIEKKKLYEKWELATEIEVPPMQFAIGEMNYHNSSWGGNMSTATIPGSNKKGVRIFAKISKDVISFRNHRGKNNFNFTHSSRTLTEAIVNLMKEALELKQ